LNTTFYYGNPYDYGMSSSEVAEIFVVVMLVMLLLVALPMAILQIIGMCKVFKKAGKPVGFAFIPVYSYYVQCEIACCKKLFWGYLPALIVSWIVSMIPVYSSEAAILVSVLSVASSIAMIVFNVIYSIRLAKAFGKSGGFAVGLIFLPFVFYMILGCGKDPYLGCGAQPQPQPQPQFQPQEETVASGVWKCEDCGAYNLNDNRFCFHCGKEKK